MAGARGERHRFFLETPEGKGRLGRPRCKCEHDIKADFEEMGWEVGALDLSGQTEEPVADS